MTLKKLIVCGAVSLALLSASFAQPKRAKHHVHIAKTSKKKKPASTRIQRTKEQFVASSDLKPMAAQLLRSRSEAAYSGVESYALKHDDAAGALAWFVIGYAHQLDGENEKAIPPLKNAREKAGEIADYVTFHLAKSYQMTGAHAEAAALLKDFAAKYPDSLFKRDAGIMLGSALIAASRVREGIAPLEVNRNPMRADVEMLLGRGYAALGETAKAVDAFRWVYYDMPLTPEADAAESELKELGRRKPLGEPNFSQQRRRAEVLYQGRQFNDSADEFKQLLKRAGKEQQPELTFAYARALYKARKLKDAKDAFDRVPSGSLSPDLAAERLYWIGEIARPDDPQLFLEVLTQLRESKPASPWLAESLLSTANSHLLKREYEEAARWYGELSSRFPDGKYGSYAHWKSAWLALRMGNTAEAKRLFEEQIKLFPGSNEAPSALYWRARLAEEDKDSDKARAYYEKLVARFRSYYYAELGRERLGALPAGSQPDPPDPILKAIGAPPRVPNLEDTVAPEDNLRVARSQLLGNGALYDLAVKELLAANGGGGAGWANREILRLYTEDNRYFRALQVAKRTVPGYFSFRIEELPRDLWNALFPRPYWDDLKKDADANRLDPFLVASLIRQESEFNPAAVSHAHAMGLMQLLPSVGKSVARQLKVGGFTPSLLLVPDVNLQLGTKYFREMVDRNGGNVEYALAAYNAGQDRVDDWQKLGPYRDKAEFVESIPFTETRDYVQAIVRNAALYHRLYSQP